MTVYGEGEEQFRPAPRRLTLLVVSASLVLISAALTSWLVAMTEQLLAMTAGWKRGLLLHAPFAGSASNSVFYRSELAGWFGAGDALIASAAVFLVPLAIHLFPIERTLLSRLTQFRLCTTVVVMAVLAPAFDRSAFAAFSELTFVDSAVWRVLFASAAIWLLLIIERRENEILTLFHRMETPAQRIRRWSVRIPAGFALLAVICFLNGYPAGAYASAGAIAATFLENVSHVPRERYSEVRDVHLRESAATLPLIAAVLIALSVWLFGAPLADRPARMIEMRKPGDVRLIEETAVPLQTAASVRKKAPPAKKRDDRIRIRWSKEKKEAPQRSR